MVVASIGTRLYGACNGIEGLGNVQTKFFDMSGIPVVPLRSYFIMHRPRRDSGGPLAMTIPLDPVSVGKAYLGGVLYLAAVVFGIIGIALVGGSGYTFQSCWGYFAIATLSVGALCASYRIRRFASYERAKEIARDLGIPHIANFIDRVYNSQEQDQNVIPTVEAQYYDDLNLDVTEADNYAGQNNNHSETSAVTVTAAPIRQPASSALETNPLVHAAVVTESYTEHEGQLPVASVVSVHADHGQN